MKTLQYVVYGSELDTYFTKNIREGVAEYAERLEVALVEALPGVEIDVDVRWGVSGGGSGPKPAGFDWPEEQQAVDTAREVAGRVLEEISEEIG